MYEFAAPMDELSTMKLTETIADETGPIDARAREVTHGCVLMMSTGGWSARTQDTFLN